jgi:hypothetical protein
MKCLLLFKFALVILISCESKDSLYVIDGFKLGTTSKETYRHIDSIGFEQKFIKTSIDYKILFDYYKTTSIFESNNKKFILSNAIKYDNSKSIGVCNFYGQKKMERIQILFGNKYEFESDFIYFDNAINLSSLEKVKAEIEKKYGKGKEHKEYKMPYIEEDEIKSLFDNKKYIHNLLNKENRNINIFPVVTKWSTKNFDIYLCFGVENYKTIFNKKGEYINFDLLKSEDTFGMVPTYRYAYLEYELKKSSSNSEF